MPRLLESGIPVVAEGTRHKLIEELVGRVSTGHESVSVARMSSPQGWTETGQRPEFLEITVVTEGCLCVEHEGGVMEVAAGQAVACEPGEWVRYSTPHEGGAEYVAVCVPAFSRDSAHRDPL